MLTRDDRLVAAGHSVDPVRWAGILDELMTRAGARFRRVEPRRRARALVVGPLAGLPRKNCWTIAEHAGDATPDGMQHLLARAKWDATAWLMRLLNHRVSWQRLTVSVPSDKLAKPAAFLRSPVASASQQVIYADLPSDALSSNILECLVELRCR